MCVPYDGAFSRDLWQRQRRGFRLDALPLGGGQPAPGRNQNHRLRPAPGADDLTGDQNPSWPDARRPEPGAVSGLWHQQLAVRIPEQVVVVAARKQPYGVGWLGLLTQRWLVRRQDQ